MSVLADLARRFFLRDSLVVPPDAFSCSPFIVTSFFSSLHSPLPWLDPRSLEHGMLNGLPPPNTVVVPVPFLKYQPDPPPKGKAPQPLPFSFFNAPLHFLLMRFD